MRKLTGSILASAVTVAAVVAAGVMGARTQPAPPPPQPPGGYSGPGDTVPPSGPPPIACPTPCPTNFTNTGCDVVCDYTLFEDPVQHNIGSMCFFPSTGFEGRSFTFTYGDWILLDQQIQSGMVQPDQDGNVTICTPQVFNIQEVLIFQGPRINGGGPDASCPTNRFPKVESQVWILDGAHGGPPPHTDPPDCDKEMLHTGVFGWWEPSDPVPKLPPHCLLPPPECVDAQVWITFNVECMRQAIAWWATNFGNNCLSSSSNTFALQCSTPLYWIAMLTCQVTPPQE